MNNRDFDHSDDTKLNLKMLRTREKGHFELMFKIVSQLEKDVLISSSKKLVYISGRFV